MRPLLVAGLLAGSLATALADEYSHRYKRGDAMRLWDNKVGPASNPQARSKPPWAAAAGSGASETYNYAYLPWCVPAGSPANPVHRWMGLGEALGGNHLVDSGLAFAFAKDTPRTTLCATELGEAEAAAFAGAVARSFWIEWVIDDLPVWGMVGESDEEGGAEAVYTHRTYTLGYNGPFLVSVNVTSSSPAALDVGAVLSFSYAVVWVEEPGRSFERRFEAYLESSNLETKIHWMAVANSFLMVLFLTGLLALVLLRTIAKDVARYSMADAALSSGGGLDALERAAAAGEGGGGGGGEESGWKLVHGDVFRPPPHAPLLAALLGAGAQLAAVTVATAGATIAGALFAGRGSIGGVALACWALSSFPAGYVSGAFVARSGGRAWIPTYALTAGLLPGCAALAGAGLNVLSLLYGATAFPFSAVAKLLLLWLLVACPLALAGTLPAFLIPAGGALPFGAIFIELHFLFLSFWGGKVYFLYGFFLLVFAMLLAVTVCCASVSTYVLLNAENHRWQWPAFLSSASAGVYVLLYSCHFFWNRTQMNGALQSAFYGATSVGIASAVALVCGAAGYAGASAFVRRVYSAVKTD